MLRTISCLVEAVLGITVACENDDLVAEVLQTDGGVHDEALCATNAQIWMEEDYCFWRWCALLAGHCAGGAGAGGVLAAKDCRDAQTRFFARGGSSELTAVQVRAPAGTAQVVPAPLPAPWATVQTGRAPEHVWCGRPAAV